MFDRAWCYVGSYGEKGEDRCVITPTEEPRYRESIYRERAIAAEQVRLAMGMSLRPADKPVHITAGIDQSDISDKYYEPPLMQVIPSACDKCPDNPRAAKKFFKKIEFLKMARYTGPKSKIARKFGEPIFGEDKVLAKKNFPPGQHGANKRRKTSCYI